MFTNNTNISVLRPIILCVLCVPVAKTVFFSSLVPDILYWTRTRSFSNTIVNRIESGRLTRRLKVPPGPLNSYNNRIYHLCVCTKLDGNKVK